MKTKALAPLIVDACVSYLKERDVGTKYHPKRGVYLLDTHLMARIVRHNCNLQATVSQDESVLMNHFLKSLIEQGVIESILTNEKYRIIEKYNTSKPAILVEKINKITWRGKKPQFLPEAIGEKTHG